MRAHLAFVPERSGEAGGFLVPPKFAADLAQMMRERAELAAHGFAGMFCQSCRRRILVLHASRERGLPCPLCGGRKLTWDGGLFDPWGTPDDERSLNFIALDVFLAVEIVGDETTTADDLARAVIERDIQGAEEAAEAVLGILESLAGLPDTGPRQR